MTRSEDIVASPGREGALPVLHDPPINPGPITSPSERRAEGRLRRSDVARLAHARWEPRPDRISGADPIVAPTPDRTPGLVPLRLRRMLASPASFFRGSVDLLAQDLASIPATGINVQLNGDAQVWNFGFIGTAGPTRTFDLRDYDETWPGPFEWDLKRLAVSVVLAARALGTARREARSMALHAAGAYRRSTHRFSEMTHLEVWSSTFNDALEAELAPLSHRPVGGAAANGTERDDGEALPNVTELVEGRRRILAAPPLTSRIDSNGPIARQVPAMLEEYRQSLQPDRRLLFDRYQLVDLARSSAGSPEAAKRCWFLLFQAPNGGPLLLQAKKAGVCAAQRATRFGGDVRHQGERVVRGQQLLQSVPDVLLGWMTAPETDDCYYLRQPWDPKASPEITTMSPAELRSYGALCGAALARGHARTGDSLAISGYLGRSRRFDEAIAAFADNYADQVELDWAAALRAVGGGYRALM